MPGVYARLARLYGPASRAASAGRQRYFLNPALGLDYLHLNTSRPLFCPPQAASRRELRHRPPSARSARVRQSFAVRADGPVPSPTVAGFRDANIYPFRPDLATARRLARGTHATAVFYSCTTPNCRQHAAIIRKNLEAIGLRVDVQEFPLGELLTRLRTKGEPFDLAIERSIYAAPDPFFFLNLPIDGTLGERGPLRRTLLQPEAGGRSEAGRPRARGHVREAGRQARTGGSAARCFRVSDAPGLLLRTNGLSRLPARLRDGPGRALPSAQPFLSLERDPTGTLAMPTKANCTCGRDSSGRV